MTVISSENQRKNKAYLESFLEKLVSVYKDRSLPNLCSPVDYLKKSSSQGDLKPFHVAIVPDTLLRINAFERGFSTSLGSTFEECGRLIALGHHKEAERGYIVREKVSLTAWQEIEKQVSVFEHAATEGIERPSLDQMIESVLSARKQDDLVEKKVTADLYILAHDNTQYFFEIKSPKPNKGQCLEIT